MIPFYVGSTSQTVDLFLQDAASPTSQGLAGLVFNTAGLTCYYRKGATGSPTAVTLATQTVGGAWSSGGFVEVDATNMKGVYRFDIPNAVIDAEGFATLFFFGAANLMPSAVRLDCRPVPSEVKAVTAAAANKIADHVRRRTQANVEASSDGDALSVGSAYGFIQQAQESDTTTTPGTLTIRKTDGATTLGTKTLTSAPADPVTGIS